MTFHTNGKTGLAIVGAIGVIVAILSGIGSWYFGWSSKVEAAVVQQRMVNAHDEALQEIVPMVNQGHEKNALQDAKLDEHERALRRIESSLEKQSDLIQMYLQSQMRRGEIPR